MFALNHVDGTLKRPLVEIVRIGYRGVMSVLLRQIARYVAQKAASDPEAREKAAKVARGVVAEAKQIAREDDRAYAAGRAFRRAFDKLQNDR
ncbi:MAG: hypothetical protein OEM91_08685 [Hyphomicrobiales bacterium]|nr:hypothetical protein [Hyphomicrobiales bacterium]